MVVLSGKGGTGKTSVVASLACLAPNKVMVDCDVDAADLRLLLPPLREERHEFWSGQRAIVDSDVCTGCGLCREVCRFGAIDEGFRVDPIACEGCAFCANVCPVSAVAMKESLSGHWFISATRYGPLVHARLGVAEENSGKLVALVRKQARRIAEEEGLDLIISDGPPGIGCPVISSLSGADLAVIVTEPTLSGMHDLERVTDVCHHFSVPAIVSINKCDINEENSRQIERYCLSHGVEVAARIPFDNIVTEALVKGLPVVEYAQGRVTSEIESLWRRVSQVLEE